MKLEIGPPPSPNRKKYPFVASIRHKGLIIDIENLDGSTRSGVGPNGKPWKTLFRGAHYGEIRGSKGTDGDLLDVYLKADPDPKADKAYIIHQNHPGNHPTKAGRFDEDKIVLGCTSVEEAKALYLRHYDRKDYLRSVTEMPFSKFKIYMRGENKGDKVASLRLAYALGEYIALKEAEDLTESPALTPLPISPSHVQEKKPGKLSLNLGTIGDFAMKFKPILKGGRPDPREFLASRERRLLENWKRPWGRPEG